MDDMMEDMMEDDGAEDELALIAARSLGEEDDLERGLYGFGPFYPPARPPRPQRRRSGGIYNNNYNRNSNKITDVSSLFSSLFNQLISSQISSQKPSRPSHHHPYNPFLSYRPRSEEDAVDDADAADGVETTPEAAASESA